MGAGAFYLQGSRCLLFLALEIPATLTTVAQQVDSQLMLVLAVEILRH